MEEKYSSVTNKIFDILKEKGISQKELSDMTGISTSAISDWKHKGAIPSAIKVQKVCEALNINPNELLGKKEDLPIKSYVITQSDELYGFVDLYENLNAESRERILAYALAMMKLES